MFLNTIQIVLFNEILFKVYKAPFCIAFENGNIEILKLLLDKDNLNINFRNIQFMIFFTKSFFFIIQ